MATGSAALSGGRSQVCEQLNRERSALLQARAEAEAARRSAIPVQPTSICRGASTATTVQQSVGLDELASRLQAMQAAFRSRAYSVPAINVEPPRQRQRSGCVGVSGFAGRPYPAAADARAGSISLGDGGVSPTPRQPAPTIDDGTIASAFDNASPNDGRARLPPGLLAAGLRRALPTPGSLRGVTRCTFCCGARTESRAGHRVT